MFILLCNTRLWFTFPSLALSAFDVCTYVCVCVWALNNKLISGLMKRQTRATKITSTTTTTRTNMYERISAKRLLRLRFPFILDRNVTVDTYALTRALNYTKT